MPRAFETVELGEGAQLQVQPLPFPKAEDLLPEVAALVSDVFDSVKMLLANGLSGQDDIFAMLPAIGGIALKLGGGKLKKLAPRVLECCSIVLDTGSGKVKYDLVKKDEYEAAFDERPDVYFAALWFAGKATFGRFFPAGAQRRKPQAPTTAESS